MSTTVTPSALEAVVAVNVVVVVIDPEVKSADSPFATDDAMSALASFPVNWAELTMADPSRMPGPEYCPLVDS